MTTIQAIDLLKGLEQSLDDYCELNDEGKTAFGMAITALELFGNSEPLPFAQPDHVADIGKKVEEDCISRQAALNAIMGQPPEPHYPAWYAAQIEKLPVTQPEIIRCKDCDWWTKQEDSVQGRCELMQMYPAGG